MKETVNISKEVRTPQPISPAQKSEFLYVGLVWLLLAVALCGKFRPDDTPSL